MAAFPLFRDTNMAAVTSRENTLLVIHNQFLVVCHPDMSRTIGKQLYGKGLLLLCIGHSVCHIMGNTCD